MAGWAKACVQLSACGIHMLATECLESLYYSERYSMSPQDDLDSSRGRVSRSNGRHCAGDQVT